MDRLSLYNEALLLCGQGKLSTLSDNVESRRLLDTVWDADGIDRCLEAGQWQFAMRTVQLDYSPSVEPSFGFQRAFDKPTDFVRVCAVCQDEFFQVPLLQYTEEAGFWFAELDTIYVKYVSNDDEYGNDLSLWPPSFGDYVSAFFASRIIARLSQDKERISWLVGAKRSPGEVDRRLKVAKSHDAMAEPTKIPARGSWTKSRQGTSRGDRGSRTNLTG